MTQYKSFDNTTHKIQTTWEKAQANQSEIDNNNIKIIETRFRSENHFKPVTIIPVVSEFQVGSSGSQVSVIMLDFPEWAINMAQPFVNFYFDSAYRPDEEVENFTDAFNDGTLEEGDISIVRWNTFHWFTKQDGLYKFNFRFDLNVRVATSVTDLGFSTAALPTFTNISLYVVNERNYNELQSGK